MLKVSEHKHALKLVDLQVNYPNEEDKEESDDEESALVTQDVFVCSCKRCNQEINGYYRYFYKCMNTSCDYSLHNFCAELPTTLKHALHPLPLRLHLPSFDWPCILCRRRHKTNEVSYCCFDSSFIIDVICAVESEKKKIQHPSHPHPLVSLISKPILGECDACGKEHKGVFFQCTTCSNFTIHNDCAFLPKSLLIQDTTNNSFTHTHPLTLCYSFPINEQHNKYYPKCRVCGSYFKFERLWIYKCEKCIYYAHLHCATSRREPFMFMLSRSEGHMVKNFKDADYPDILRLPFPDQTYSIPKQLIFKEIGNTTYGNDKVSLHEINHQHRLVLVDTECIDIFGPTSSKINSLIMCHDPMKKREVLCNGCVRPIMDMPFYKCGASEDESCIFALHEWCTRLPTKVDNHPGHPKHTLVLMSNVLHMPFNIFTCAICFLPCNGYAYGCTKCKYYVDVTCGLMPDKITHKSHPDHLLGVNMIPVHSRCLICLSPFGWERCRLEKHLFYTCNDCDVYIHPECALLLPETIMHPYDKHPMHLSYLPVENHKSEYFCEICEFELNPHSCFYHCDECVQSVHSTCAPLILCSEIETYSDGGNTIYKFSNVKFGSIHNVRGHPHSLTFAQGIQSDGRCRICQKKLQYEMILKCSKCEFAIDYKCCERLNNS